MRKVLQNYNLLLLRLNVSKYTKYVLSVSMVMSFTLFINAQDNTIMPTTVSQPDTASERSVFKPTLSIKGYSQVWYSYGWDDVANSQGFSLNYARINPYGNLTDKISWSIQFGFDQMEAKVLDAYLNYKYLEECQVAAGFLPSPGSRSAAIVDELYSTTKMNLLNRPSITQVWGKNTMQTGYRDLGVQIHGDVMYGLFNYAVMLANPSAAKADQFIPKTNASTYSHTNNGYKLWGRLEAKPMKGLGVGVFAGNGEIDTDSEGRKMKLLSYGAHAIYRADPYWFFAEYIVGKTDTSYNTGRRDTTFAYKGYYAEAGYKIDKFQPVVRFEVLSPYDGLADKKNVEQYYNFHIGLNYYPNDKVKLLVNYIIRTEKVKAGTCQLDNNLFIVGLQYVFSDK